MLLAPQWANQSWVPRVLGQERLLGVQQQGRSGVLGRVLEWVAAGVQGRVLALARGLERGLGWVAAGVQGLGLVAAEHLELAQGQQQVLELVLRGALAQGP